MGLCVLYVEFFRSTIQRSLWLLVAIAIQSCLIPVAEQKCVSNDKCIGNAQCIKEICVTVDGGNNLVGGGAGGGTAGGTGGVPNGGGVAGGIAGGSGGAINGGGVASGNGGGSVVVHQRVSCNDFNSSFGSAVSLQSPTATFSQSSFGPFTVARAIDGNLSGGFGWAIDGQLSRSQTAAFETVQDTQVQVAGTRLLFTLHHSFAIEHALGRFRLSVTASPRSSFADGNEGIDLPGDVGAAAIWTILVPRRYCVSTNGPFLVLADESLLATDTNSTFVDYVIEADTSLAGVTGVRLEALTDNSLPFSGPGLNSNNGNFVLSEFTMRVGDSSM
jgi:hypothetical protein